MEFDSDNNNEKSEQIINFEVYGEEEYQKGLEYLYGNNDVRQDFRQALYYFSKAAKDGHAEAIFQVGCLYMYGETTVLRNYKKAADCFQKSADEGLALAQFNLFQCCFYGYGVEQNIEKALKYCELAASQGYLQAQLILGDFYRYGVGIDQYGNTVLIDNEQSIIADNSLVIQDIKSALKWYDKARKQGNQLADIRFWGTLAFSQNTYLK